MATLFTRVIQKAIAPLWARYEGTDYLKVAQKLKEQEYTDPLQRQKTQFGLLKQLIEHAWNNCPYYRQKWQDLGIEPKKITSLEDLTLLPILTKAEIQTYAERIRDQRLSPENLVPRKTSGSTGKSLRFFVDEQQMQFKRGVTLYRDSWSGWQLGEPRAMVWGNPEYRQNWRLWLRNAILERGFFLDTLRMDEDAMREFASESLRQKPTLYFGHAHSLYLFADFCADNGIEFHRPRGIISTAMVLHDFERKRIEEVFGVRVFNRYGCEEVSLIASECEQHQGLHINTDAVIVEIVDEKATPCAPGKQGRIIVTDIRNTAMPFIRYEVGDMGVFSEHTCSCKRTYPLLDKIAGRTADYLKAPNGDWVSGISLTENFATLIAGIDQVQIIQDSLKHLELRIVKTPTYDQKSEAEIAELIEKRFGSQMRYTVTPVEKIAPEPSGKYRFAICKIDK